MQLGAAEVVGDHCAARQPSPLCYSGGCLCAMATQLLKISTASLSHS